MATKEELVALKDNPDLPLGVRELFNTAIEREEFKSGMAAKEVVANALSQISKILAEAQVSSSATANPEEVERIVKAQLAQAQIGLSNLDDSVKSLLGKVPTNVTLSVITQQGIVTSNVTIDPEFLVRPLTQLLLSDLAANNNAYLYGGAGTGKTYTAVELARLIGWKTIEVNCNQFTSPLDLLGGQTISGYQEGAVTQAWKNDIKGEKVNGVVLVLDELPKIDPNTAGILNSALAKVKQSGDRSMITNGRGERFEKQNIFIVATGNVKLNETSEDYEANFKQDLSLQDRFVGSTYPIFVYYNTEVTSTMKGFLFIWLYMVKLREFIEAKRLQNRAFVSIRIMESMRDTYRVYRDYEDKLVAGGEKLITNPKTLQQACESFFSLFPTNVVEQMKNDTDYKGFTDIIAEKNRTPLTDPMNMNFDTQMETEQALKIAMKNDADKNKIYQTA
jgi:cobaltochelatase CobS